jgi:5-formyltetrahydrofolate cyclo-ligase
MQPMSGREVPLAGPELHAAKVELRRRIASARDAMAPAARAAGAAAALARLVTLPEWRRARTLAATASFGSELDTDPLLAAALGAGKHLALPRIDARTRTLELFYVEDPATQLAAGRWNIREPIPERCRRADLAAIDLVIVPGVAFDRRGGRLGYGGGYYDRLLPGMRSGAPRVALAFSAQVVDAVPMGPRDLRVDVVVTELETLRAERLAHSQ